MKILIKILSIFLLQIFSVQNFNYLIAAEFSSSREPEDVRVINIVFSQQTALRPGERSDNFRPVSLHMSNLLGAIENCEKEKATWMDNFVESSKKRGLDENQIEAGYKGLSSFFNENYLLNPVCSCTTLYCGTVKLLNSPYCLQFEIGTKREDRERYGLGITEMFRKKVVEYIPTLIGYVPTLMTTFPYGGFESLFSFESLPSFVSLPSLVSLPKTCEEKFDDKPFGICPLLEALYKFDSQSAKLSGKCLNLMIISGHGLSVDGTPILCGGLLFHDMLMLGTKLNQNVHENYVENISSKQHGAIEDILKMDTTEEHKEWYDKNIEKETERLVPVVAGHYVAKPTVETIKAELDRSFDVGASLGLKTRVLILNSCYSASFVPLLAPLIESGGIIFCNICVAAALTLSGIVSIMEAGPTCSTNVVKALCKYYCKSFYNLWPLAFVKKNISSNLLTIHIVVEKNSEELKTSAATDISDREALDELPEIKKILKNLHENNVRVKCHSNVDSFKVAAMTAAVLANDYSVGDDYESVMKMLT
jgi:hypothetical protein